MKNWLTSLGLLTRAVIKLDPYIGRRFCKVEMRGCMANVRHDEQWGIVIDAQTSRDHPTDNTRQIVGKSHTIYDGGQGRYREVLRKKGQADYLHVRYANGTESWEPRWWVYDHKTHLEYQH